MTNGGNAFDFAYNRVKAFLEGEVSNFVITDLERLGLIQNHPYCTIPESLAVFSVLDLLGFLMRPDFNDETTVHFPELLHLQHGGQPVTDSDRIVISRLSSEAGRTSENVEYMCFTWLGRIAREYSDSLNIALLITLFRHGGAHQFFPKIGAIGKVRMSQPVIKIVVADDQYPITYLNQNRFRVDFLTCLRELIDIITQKRESDLQTITGESVADIVLRINARLDARLYIDRQQLLEILSDHAPRLLPYCPHTHTAATYQHISYDT